MTKILFIHHSTGALLLRYGNIRNLLKQKAPTIELWDHAYNLSNPIFLSKIFGRITFKTGLSDGQGKLTGKDFNIVLSNNSPKEYAEIFSRSSSDNTLNQILQFDVIAFKNCFPTTKIATDARLEEIKLYYSQIFESVKKFRNKTFIILTPPPLRSELTKPEWAQRARSLANWLCLRNNVDNIKVFDFLDLLAEKEGKYINTLKRDYCRIIPLDSHPNKKANIDIGEKFADFLIETTTK